MPNSILWIGLVVLWVFVLFPMLADRHPRIRQHTEAALSTRVLHRGDAKRRTRKGPATGHDTDPDYVPVRRKHHHDDPEDRMTRSDDSRTAESDDEDFDTARERDTESSTSATADAGVSAETAGEPEAAETEPETAELDHDADDSESESETAESDRDDQREDDLAEEPEFAGEPEEPEEPRRSEAPLRARIPAVRDEDSENDEREARDDLDESEEDDEDFVPTRRGRGGYDPEADAIARAARYTFRQRAVLGLVLSTVAFAAGGFLLSAGLWWLCALSGVVLVAYMAYLRRQVQLEEDIRRRRAERLSRRRKRQAEDEEQARRAPERPVFDRESARTQLRRAVLVEPDDEDPSFEHLELFDAATARAARTRASGGRERRAVGE
ncbi:gephyrin-like molybdotransferase receptor GlpR [Nocardia sp. NPDC127526]|uniref:divisome protein SepX/GlpR n=1 Tax=Nocardia sp. NPDC127526 TaxID=3345393 RepID=UPI00363E429A